MSARGLCLGLTLIVVFGISARAQAQEEAQEDDYARSGPYLGLGMGFGWEQFDDTGGFSDVDNALGLDAWAGYRLSPYVAAEAQLEYLDRFNTSTIETYALAFTGNLKGYLMTGPVQPFAVVGLGFLRINDETGTGIRFGGGIDLYDSPNVSFGATLSYVLALGAVDGFDYLSLVLAFQYRF